MSKQSLSPVYVMFYILFSPDTWRVVIGVILAIVLVPLIVTPDIYLTAEVVVYAMVATIGYSISGLPAKQIAQLLKKLILKDKMPPY